MNSWCCYRDLINVLTFILIGIKRLFTTDLVLVMFPYKVTPAIEHSIALRLLFLTKCKINGVHRSSLHCMKARKLWIEPDVIRWNDWLSLVFKKFDWKLLFLHFLHVLNVFFISLHVIRFNKMSFFLALTSIPMRSPQTLMKILVFFFFFFFFFLIGTHQGGYRGSQVCVQGHVWGQVWEPVWGHVEGTGADDISGKHLPTPKWSLQVILSQHSLSRWQIPFSATHQRRN